MVDESPADLQLDCNKLAELNLISKAILDFAGSCKIWLFYGDMGSGKTTLIKSIGASFGVIYNVNRPTFSIVNEYLNMNDEIYYHFDFGDSWLFEIKKSRKKKEENKQDKYPRIIKSSGVNPEQYPEYEE